MTSPAPYPGERIRREELSGLIDDFLISRLDPAQEDFALRRFIPELRWNRLDLAIKLYYAKTCGADQPEIARQLYDAHIHAFSLGDMREPGNPEKDRIERFREDFAGILASFREKGFDPAQSLVPLATDGSVLNGAHRCACALLLGQSMLGVEIGLEPFYYDHRYFHNRGMPDDLLNTAVLKHVEFSPQSRIALIWPSANGKDAAIRRILGPLIHYRKICLNTNGALNFLSQVYADEPWTGTAANGFPGIRVKRRGCFAGVRPMRVMVYQADDRDPVAVKAQIRALFDLGKHSVHMTDTHEEALMIARLVLNDNSIRFMNRASPFETDNGIALNSRLRDYLHRHDTDPEDILIDGGFVMAAHGLRPAHEIEFLSYRQLPSEKGIQRHEAEHYPVALRDMLADPRHHFHFWGLKFVSPEALSQMKAARAAGRDAEDLRLLTPLLHQRRFRIWRRNRIYACRVRFARLRRSMIRILAGIGLRDPVRRLYLAWRRPGS